MILYISMAVFGGIGGYIAVLFGDTSFLSGWSILTSTIGAVFGVFAAKWASDYLG